MLVVLPSIFNRELAGPVTPLNDCHFLLPMGSREEMKELCQLGTFLAVTKDGPCVLNLSPWSAELGATGRALGDGQWVHIWNLPLHAWCWPIIVEVLHPLGELVALSQAELPHKYFISVLVRHRASITLPLELDFSMGMRKYQVLFIGDRGVAPVYQRDLGRYVLEAEKGTSGASAGGESRAERVVQAA